VTSTPAPDEAPRLAFGFAVRNAIGVAVPLIAGVIADDIPAGAVAGGGALIAGFADVGDTRRHRAIAMLVTSIAGAVSTAVGVFVSETESLALIATATWGVATGLLVAGGPAAGVVGLMMTVALVLFAGEDTGPRPELELAGFALAGGSFQAALAAAVPTRSGYPARPLGVRRVLGEALAAARSPAEPIARHSLRLGMALAAATAVYRLLPVDRGYWIPVTVLFVMRPQAGATRTRVAQRFVGTVVGLVAITLVVAILEPGALVLALLCAACMVPAYAYLWIDYTRFNAGLAGAVVALAALLGLPEPVAALNRFVDTIVGLAIIIVFLALLPEHPRSARPRGSAAPPGRTAHRGES
jgi:uncharacterized membrane protein YccC